MTTGGGMTTAGGDNNGDAQDDNGRGLTGAGDHIAFAPTRRMDGAVITDAG